LIDFKGESVTMTRARRAKKRRVAGFAAAQEEPNYEHASTAVNSNRGKFIKSKQAAEHRASTNVNYQMPEDDEIEATIPFCCAICKCSDARKDSVSGGKGNLYICPSEDLLW
jgi:hypothetical protein